jgi:hypothetical protein
MITFLEFYEVFVKFVLFKLYHTQGLKYPPTEDQGLKDAGKNLISNGKCLIAINLIAKHNKCHPYF